MNSVEAKIFDVELLQLNNYYQHLASQSPEENTTHTENYQLQSTQILTDLNQILTNSQVKILQTNEPNAFSLSDAALHFSPEMMDVENKKALWQAIIRYLDEHSST